MNRNSLQTNSLSILALVPYAYRHFRQRKIRLERSFLHTAYIYIFFSLFFFFFLIYKNEFRAVKYIESAATTCVPLRLVARRASKVQKLELKLDVPFQPSTMFILKYYKVQITSVIIPRASSISPDLRLITRFPVHPFSFQRE